MPNSPAARCVAASARLASALRNRRRLHSAAPGLERTSGALAPAALGRKARVESPNVDRDRARLARSCPFHAFLGVEPLAIHEERVRLRLPFAARPTNNGSVLHGGVAAALSCRALWLASGGAGSAQLASLHVNYLRAAREDLLVEAKRVRLGRSVGFARVEIASHAGEPVADALLALRLRGDPPARPSAPKGPRDAEPGVAPDARVGAPFLRNLGVEILAMGEGASRVRLPWRSEPGDGSGFHEGALLALLDVCGAMSAHAAHGGDARRAATISLQAQAVAAALPPADLCARGRCLERDGDTYWSDVEIARDSTRERLARGSIAYRIADTR